ncbi:MAG: hypothetical protein KatS3mg110_3731 [Pirellulaceae bacterium]|nr:MAG: hypothetical protein KatS3mg110_3731 [Pirellulaceae bacterium]
MKGRAVRAWLSVLGALLAIAFGLVSILLSGIPIAPSKVELLVEPNGYDFGPVRQAETKEARFTIRNVGRQAIEILAIQYSCGCTGASVEATRLNPRESTVLTVRLATGSARGDKRAIVYVVYRGAIQRAIRALALSLRATVVPDYRFLPSEVIFMAGRSGTTRVRFRPVFENDFAITDVKIESSDLVPAQLTWDLHAPEPNDPDWVVTLEYRPREKDPFLQRAWLVVWTTSAREPQVRIPVVIVEPPTNSQLVPR